MQVNDTINKSIEFILSNRQEDGMWLNFLTRTHGESADWVSSYVGLSLLDSGVERSELIKTAESILKRQRENGGFSYNHKIVPDADSTAFAILFLSHFGYQQEVEKAKDFLVTHQKQDGSFSTYRPELIREYYRIGEDISVDGWCSGSPDVTASALRAMPNNERALRYTLESQQEDGSWRAYWWNDDIYSTSELLLAIKDTDLKDNKTKAQKWLAQTKPKTPFYLSLSLQGLMTNGHYGDLIDEGIQQIISAQKEDGSWETYPKLRFPHPSNTNPSENPKRWRDDVRDQNRLFTTATCLKALSDYKKR